jgi:UPF0176 protein
MEKSQTVQVISFYKFVPVPAADLDRHAAELEYFAEQLDVHGLMILGPEGVNTTISGSKENAQRFIQEVDSRLKLGKVDLKISEAPKHPFRKFQTKIRDEIVTLGQPGVVPTEEVHGTHLSPEDWHKMLQDPDVIVLDTRNWYETDIGKFKSAIDPRIEEFREFPEYLAKAGIPKDKKVLIYCTGGIRCEKAIIEMKRQGYDQTYQLEGGILAYLEKFPNKEFEGECFVFDHRVAVDQNLQPSTTFAMCPHCGQPSDEKIVCVRCDVETKVCSKCREQGAKYATCSKNCLYHYSLNPGKKGRKQFIDSVKKPAHLA